MASIHRDLVPVVKICLILLAAITVAAAGGRSVLSELYQQAVDQNRPLILVVDNHSKNAKQAQKETAKQDEKIPFYYMSHTHNNPQHKTANVLAHKPHQSSSSTFLLNLLSKIQSLNDDSKNKNVGRTDDRDRRIRNRDQGKNDNYYKPRQLKDRNDRNRNDRYRNDRVRNDRDRSLNYRDRYDQDRDRKDRYRSDNRNDRNRYRSDNNRFDQDRNRDRYYDRYDKSRYQPKDNYGANVLKTLLRYSNRLSCDAKYDCKDSCRMLRQPEDCEDLCDKNYSCEDSDEKAPTDDCDGRVEDCADEQTDHNPSTRGPKGEDFRS